ncbi:MAG: ABC transporter ATP-binding protein [Chloroflexi bacterium]|nr:MAG: ABC transporter ATP-binding protein [Chloroflexota bacterium]
MKRPNKRPTLSPAARGALKRTLKYLGRTGNAASMPFAFMVIATLSQLAVPRLVRNILDGITHGVMAGSLLETLPSIPAAQLPAVLPKMLALAALPADWTKAQLLERLTADQLAAPAAVLAAGAAIVLFASMRGLFAFLQAYWAERNSQTVAFEIRNELFDKIQRLSFSYHDQNQTGQLMIRATDDIEKVRLFIGQGLVQLAGASILLVATLSLLLTTNWQLALVSMPILPAALIIFMIFGIVSQPLFAKVQARISDLNTVLQENLAGIKVVKAFAREEMQQAKFRTAAGNLLSQSMTVSRVFSFLFPVVLLVANLGQASVLYFGGKQILNASLTLGEYQEFSLYLIYLFLPLAQFGIIITQLGQASASAARIFEILDTTSDVQDKPDALTLPEVSGRVTFDNVTFKYPGGGEPVLSEVSFTVEPGQCVALLGATGSGKTTIINLLPRFYDPSSGSIMIDGLDLRSVTLDSLRSQIGIVLQETTLFSSTIRENIAFGRPSATLAEVQAAARAAAADDFIDAMPAGYDTPVGERGSTLSGGQKQRIAIARALLLNPHLLILDDATSSVDLQTESRIQAALDRLMRGRTSFVIAQRISTVINADLILVLDRGKIVASGRHLDLLENNGLYAEICRSQLTGDPAQQLVEA